MYSNFFFIASIHAFLSNFYDKLSKKKFRNKKNLFIIIVLKVWAASANIAENYSKMVIIQNNDMLVFI